MNPTEELFHIGKDPLEMTNKAMDESAEKQLKKMRIVYDEQLDKIKKEATADHSYQKYTILFDRNSTAEEKKPHLIGIYEAPQKKTNKKKKKH